MPQTLLPDNSPFPFWEDATVYARAYHVAQQHPGASDNNPGTADRPFATITRAAAVLQPGEKVIVHTGVYRECVEPARGGGGPDRMIAYEAAPGESVIIRASDPWTPATTPGTDWQLPSHLDGLPIFVADLPLERFTRGFNPFQTVVMAFMPWFPWHRRPTTEIQRTLLPRGQLFQDGHPLTQVANAYELADRPGTFFVGSDGSRLFFRLFGDVHPACASLELTTRGQCFAPRVAGLGYIRVAGLTLEHAANPLPQPHRGALSTTAGHHWIIEGNTVRFATCLGIDIGWQREVQPKALKETSGGHIVRRNTVTDCGTAGIAGTAGMDNCLIEDNRFERIGTFNLEHCYEAAAIKFHVARGTLIRRNVMLHLTDACGIWMDWMCANNRLHGNVIADVQTLLAGIYIEANLEPNLVDGNIIADIRDVPTNKPPKDDFAGGNGISVDISDFTRVENNLLLNIQGHYGIAVHLCQKGRILGGRRAATLEDSRILRNMLIDCPKRVYLSRPEKMTIRGNFYDLPDGPRFEIEEPNRQALFDLQGWQRHFHFDEDGGQMKIDAAFDPDTLTLTLKPTGRMELTESVGPFDAGTLAKVATGEEVRMQVPQLGYT